MHIDEDEGKLATFIPGLVPIVADALEDKENKDQLD